jgi:hypothetical protein
LQRIHLHVYEFTLLVGYNKVMVKADQQAIEVIEDRVVLTIHGAVRLVDHDEIEMADAESAALCIRTSIRPIMVG